jgi:hypothetical protein
VGSDLYVVETSDDIFVGTIEFVQDAVVVRSGFAGHPQVVDADDIERVTLAEQHPDVVFYEDENQIKINLEEYLTTSRDYIKVG